MIGLNRINSEINTEKSILDSSYVKIQELSAKSNTTISEIKKNSSQYIASSSPSLKGSTVTATKEYNDGDELHYTTDNGTEYTLTYKESYGGFVLNVEEFATKDNITSFMLTDTELEEIGANVIVEFAPNNIKYNEQAHFGTNYSNESQYGLRMSKNNELPISRIYNVDNGLNKIYFEFEQYWAIDNRQIGGSKDKITGGQACLLCSLVNSIPFDAQNSYNSDTIIGEMDNRFRYVLEGANKYSRSLQNVIYVGELYNTLNDNNSGNEYISSWTLNDKFDDQTSYVVRITTESNKFLGLSGESATDGNHNIAAIPDGSGGYYLLDPNNFEGRPNYHYTPHVTQENLEKAARKSLKLELFSPNNSSYNA